MADAKRDDKDVEGNDLGALISNELRSARRYADTELTTKRTLAIEYLHGTMRDVPPRPNGSRFMSRDLSDVMSWMLPGVMRVFGASDQMCMYEPETPNDEEFAKQATDYANYLFFRDNDGYRNLFNATHDSLAIGNGVVHHYWDPTPKIETSQHTRLSGEQVAMLLEDEDVEVLTQQKNKEMDAVPVMDPASGQMVQMPVETYDLKIARTKARGKICIEACKPENFFLDSEAVTIEEARFCAYLYDNRTRSDLMEMAEYYGWERSVIEELPADNVSSYEQEGLARDVGATSFANNSLKSGQLIDLYVCYIKADVDDDGIAETVQAWYAGYGGAGTVLGWDVYEDDLPFSDIPCYPVPHRWDADAVSDRVMDVQAVKTVLLRNGLDNLYASTMPMQEVDEGSVKNPDILANPKFGGIIWKKPGSAKIERHEVPFVADKAFTALEYMDTVIAKRTGVSRTTMALDPEALQKQTATASQNQRDAGYSQIELVARNMAELGWKRVFRQLLKLVVKHQDRPRTIRLRDKWVEMDPRSWNASMDATINVGLGTGSRDRDMMMLQQVLMNQMALADRFVGVGMNDEALELLPKIVNTMSKIAESAGLKNPEDYYPEFAEEKVEQLKQMAAQRAQQPDPAVELEKAKGEVAKELEGVKAQTTMAVEQGKNQLAAQTQAMQSEVQIRQEQAQLQADLTTKEADRQNALIVEQAKLQSQIQIESMKIQSAERIKLAELDLRREEMAQQRDIERERMASQAVIADRNNQAKAEQAKSKRPSA